MSEGRLKIGAVYPQIELGGDPDAARAIGRAAEVLGFDHLLAYDHVLGSPHDREPALSGPYTDRDPFHDPFVLFAHLAGMTSRLTFMTGVLVLPQRQTALVAKQAADLDVLSGGRLRLGVGTGWNYVEYEALGQDFGSRGARAEEQVELLRKLWTEPLVTFRGRFDTVERAGILPRPQRCVPIWFGGASDVSFRRAIRTGDGFLFSGVHRKPADELARLRTLATEMGRDLTGFGLEAMVHRADPAAVATAARDWSSVGGTHLSVVTMGQGFDSVEAHVDYIHRVADTLSIVVTAHE